MHITHPSSHHEADACGAHPVCSTMRRPSRAQHTQCPSRTAPPLADAWRRVHVPRTETGRKFGHMGCRASLGKSESRPDCARRAPRRRRRKIPCFQAVGRGQLGKFSSGPRPTGAGGRLRRSGALRAPGPLANRCATSRGRMYVCADVVPNRPPRSGYNLLELRGGLETAFHSN